MVSLDVFWRVYDHIGGILKIGDLGFHDIYFNAYDGTVNSSSLSASQNQRLFHVLPESIVHSNVLAGDVIEIGGARLIIHEPTTSALSRAKGQMKEADAQLSAVSDWSFTLDELMEREYPSSDTSASNQASVVFTFEYGESRLLFTGDAWSYSVPGGTFNLIYKSATLMWRLRRNHRILMSLML